MESSSSKKALEQERQAELRRQIAALQAQLTGTEVGLPVAPESPKRRPHSGNLLAPATPSPKKKRKLSHAERPSTSLPVTEQRPRPAASTTVTSSSSSSHAVSTQTKKHAPSTVLEKLAKVHSQEDTRLAKGTTNRSSAFTQPAVATSFNDSETGATRDDRLAIVEDLVLGPVDHKPPFDDPRFEKLEPNSGIRLSSRAIPFEDFQDHLRGRYYLSPSKLYSVVRLLPSKQGYDVPVSGDWLTIAVVAERGKVKCSQAPVGIGRDDKMGADEEDEDTVDQLDISTEAPVPAKGPPRPKRKRKDEPPRPSGKKYVNMKLVDFGCRTARDSSATGGQTVIRGDASLSLLLFESDGYDVVTKENGKKEKIYRGGSKGAFEKMSMLKEGAVVAFLNPRILKPFQRSGDTPHPTDNILALTPESVESIAVIGYSLDLGMCKAVRRDGTTCGSWCDRRVADVCDWHIQHAVERKRAGRAEFSSGTSGMSSYAKRKKTDYDPAKQWGLKPERESNSATYVVSGHVISGSGDSKTLFLSESMGRDAQAKASRKASTLEADRALQQLLKRDKAGSKAVATAREFAKKQTQKVKKEEKEKPGGKARVAKVSDTESESEASDEENRKPHKNAYSAHLIKQLGFDPTAKDGRKTTDPQLQSKLDALAALQVSKRDIDLAPRPGKKKSCVDRPVASLAKPTTSREDSPLHFHDSESEDDLERAEKAVFGKVIDSSAKEDLICLDSSDVEPE
ncbi:uncharacterized protein B0H18DRAFT_1120236 [Fomitopsis serialis]|uniref:uncharacterized protein n=1 Tax=Fomitopsis serialis TaxID=139415 RepID=UPI00200760C4|nr:uncharacterized protein B0H18DRAFT_1120236 [Neoantrodia serialis]KAH9923896.1 hypothetical protein B0H18DRAFT_1120236 [Neoantrodia serialis]